MFSVHITLEKFENESFTLNTHQMFSVHVTLEKFENITIADRLVLDLCLRKTGAEKSRDVIIFEKLRFQNVFLSHTETSSRVFKVPPI